MNSAPSFNRGSWVAQSLALFFPVTAALHHAFFYRPTCMLNPVGLEYNAETVSKMLRQDPSIWLAALFASIVCVAGLKLRWPIVRAWVAPFLIGFLPLTVWIWDIPFAGRPVCTHFHDEHLALPLIGTIHTRHIYLLGLVVFVTLFALRSRTRRERAGTAHAPT